MAQETNVQDKPTDVTGAGFGPKANVADDKLPENSKERLDEKLDQGVEESFPGSDPVSVKITK